MGEDGAVYLAETLELFSGDADLPDYLKICREKILPIHQLADEFFRNLNPPVLRKIQQRTGRNLHRPHAIGEKPHAIKRRPVGQLESIVIHGADTGLSGQRTFQRCRASHSSRAQQKGGDSQTTHDGTVTTKRHLVHI